MTSHVLDYQTVDYELHSRCFGRFSGDGIECEFCKKEFTSLGRHRWRCKARVNTNSIILDQQDRSSTVTMLQDRLKTIRILLERMLRSLTQIIW